jgi:hypothetical protein
MGLDMYARTTKEPLAGAVDFKVSEPSELHYWRKHPDLHGWMEGEKCCAQHFSPYVFSKRP